MCSGLQTVFVDAGIRSCHAGGFTLAAILISSGYTTMLATMGGPTHRFIATTFVLLGRSYK